MQLRRAYDIFHVIFITAMTRIYHIITEWNKSLHTATNGRQRKEESGAREQQLYLHYLSVRTWLTICREEKGFYKPDYDRQWNSRFPDFYKHTSYTFSMRINMLHQQIVLFLFSNPPRGNFQSLRPICCLKSIYHWPFFVTASRFIPDYLEIPLV